MRPLALTLSLVAYSLLTGCSPGGGRDFIAGTREGAAFDTEFVDAKFAIVGYARPTDQTLQTALAIRASSSAVSCDDLSFYWDVDGDPRRSAIRVPDHPDSDDLAVFAAWSHGTKWKPWNGGGTEAEGGPQITSPTSTPDPVMWDVSAAAAYTWKTGCTGGGVQASSGRLYSGTLIDTTSNDPRSGWLGGDQRAFEDYPVLVHVDDTARFNIEFEADVVSAEAHFDATYCGAWLVTDRPPLPPVDECP